MCYKNMSDGNSRNTIHIIKIPTAKTSIKYLLAHRIFTQKCMKYDISIFYILSLSHTHTHTPHIHKCL